MNLVVKRFTVLQSVTVSNVSQWQQIGSITALLPSISIGLFAFPISGTSTLFINIWKKPPLPLLLEGFLTQNGNDICFASK